MTLCATLLAPWRLALQTRESPRLRPHEIRLAVSMAGVCGTDLALYKGDYPAPLPLVPGHEFCGTAVEAGSPEFACWVGRRATAEINNHCIARNASNPCAACRRGMPNHCLERTVMGIIRRDGAFAEEIVVPAHNLHAIPDSLSDTEAVFVEPVAAALRTFEVMPLEGEARFGSPAGGRPWIAVLGVGRLGLLIAAVAQALGARVIGLARTERSLERAAAYCEALVRADDEERAIRQVKTRTEGLGADIVVEATGSPAGLPLACRLVRPRGSVALKSTPGLPADGLNPTQLAVDEIRLQGSRCGPFDKAIRFLAEKRLDCEALATAVFPLAQAEQAILAAMHEPKALIRCRS